MSREERVALFKKELEEQEAIAERSTDDIVQIQRAITTRMESLRLIENICRRIIKEQRA